MLLVTPPVRRACAANDHPTIRQLHLLARDDKASVRHAALLIARSSEFSTCRSITGPSWFHAEVVFDVNGRAAKNGLKRTTVWRRAEQARQLSPRDLRPGASIPVNG